MKLFRLDRRIEKVRGLWVSFVLTPKGPKLALCLSAALLGVLIPVFSFGAGGPLGCSFGNLGPIWVAPGKPRQASAQMVIEDNVVEYECSDFAKIDKFFGEILSHFPEVEKPGLIVFERPASSLSGVENGYVPLKNHIVLSFNVKTVPLETLGLRGRLIHEVGHSVLRHWLKIAGMNLGQTSLFYEIAYHELFADFFAALYTNEPDIMIKSNRGATTSHPSVGSCRNFREIGLNEEIYRKELMDVVSHCYFALLRPKLWAWAKSSDHLAWFDKVRIAAKVFTKELINYRSSSLIPPRAALEDRIVVGLQFQR